MKSILKREIPPIMIDLGLSCYPFLNEKQTAREIEKKHKRCHEKDIIHIHVDGTR